MNTHSSQQPRSSHTPADAANEPGRAASSADTRQARRLLGVGVLVFGLAAIVTIFICLFTALTWAVPVLSAAMALSCWLVVIAINGEAADGAVERRGAPGARPASADAGAEAGSAGAPGSARKPQSASAAERRPAAGVQSAEAQKADAAAAASAGQVRAGQVRAAESASAPGSKPTVQHRPAASAEAVSSSEAPSGAVTPQVPAAREKAGSASPAAQLIAQRRAKGAPKETRAERICRMAASSMRRNDVPTREVLDLDDAPTGEIPVVSSGERRVREVVDTGEFTPRPVPEPTYVTKAKAGQKADEKAEESSAAAASAAERETAAAEFAEAAGTVPELLDAAADDGTSALKHGRKAIRADKQVATPGSVSRAAQDAAYEKVNDLLARRRA